MRDLEFAAMNIVNQILDKAGTGVDTRQSINDDCRHFVEKYLESLVYKAIMRERGKETSMTDFGAVVDASIKQPDELSFVDEDIRELFEGCSYIMGMPLMAQLIKELRLQRQARAKGESP